MGCGLGGGAILPWTGDASSGSYLQEDGGSVRK